MVTSLESEEKAENVARAELFAGRPELNEAKYKGKGKGLLKSKGRDNGCVARAIDLHVQFYGVSEKTKGLIQTVGRFKVERYTEKMEAKLEMKRAEAAAMSEQEAKNGEKRERSLMSRAD